MDELKFPNGFEFARVPAMEPNAESKTFIAIKLKSREDFHLWFNELNKKNNFSWKKKRGDFQRHDKLVIHYVCHHAKLG